ncbi:MAG: hypothetical protein JWR10_4718 [Rubritepida sp.]|nr:hypothetical protein [Rubritepida sp.]
MRKLLPVLALSGLLGFTACTDPYGNVDSVATGLLGAGLLAVTGLAIAASSPPRQYGPRYGYGGPRYAQGYGRRGW